MPLAAGNGDRGVIAEHLAANHGHGLALRRSDLARYERGTGVVFRQDQFAKAGTRTRAEEADVVGDLEQAGRDRIDGAVRENVSVVARQSLKFFGGSGAG